MAKKTRRSSESEEFERMRCDPCLKEAAPGDRVLVALHPIGKGHAGYIDEAIVLEVADLACFVEFKGYGRKRDRLWVHRFVIVDVLGPPPAEYRGYIRDPYDCTVGTTEPRFPRSSKTGAVQ